MSCALCASQISSKWFAIACVVVMAAVLNVCMAQRYQGAYLLSGSSERGLNEGRTHIWQGQRRRSCRNIQHTLRNSHASKSNL